MENLNLENVKPGDEIAILNPKGKGFLYALAKVGEYSEPHKAFRLCSFNGKPREILPNDGKGYYAMHPKTVPHYYYSANPLHIKNAKIQIENARIKREQIEKENKEKLEEFRGKLETLLKEYDATIYPVQTNGDDQGVEIELEISINNAAFQVKDL